jgi:hypothetical protein
MDIESEMKRMEALQSKYASVNAAIVQARETVVRGHRQIGEARIAAVLEPEKYTPKVTEALCKKLDAEVKTAEAEIQKLSPEAEALSGAIACIETEILPLRHGERLHKQSTLRERYAAIASRMLEAANALAALSAEAKSIYDGTHAAFPKDELCEGQPIVRAFAGLSSIWDPTWINYGDGCRRDLVVEAVWNFDRTLVDPTDRVALTKEHQENYRLQRSAEIEKERQARLRQDRRGPEDEPAKGPREVRGKVLIPNPQNPNWYQKQI